MAQILCFTMIPLFYVGALIYGAQSRPHFDQSEARMLRRLSVGLVAFALLYGTSILFWAAMGPPPAELSAELGTAVVDFLSLPMARALPAFLLVIISCTAALATLWSAPFRQLLARTVFRDGDFRDNASTHIVALVLAFVLLAIILGSQAFLAGELAVGEISAEQIVLQAFLLLACTVLGVGYPMRRSERKAIVRLGLRVPVPLDWVYGIGGGVLLLIVVVLGSLIWQLVASPAVYSEQTAAAREFGALFNQLPLILLVSALAAVSEEILFRGALQPIFGLWATSAFFAIFHIQYGLTPSLLLIFLVGVGFGILRQRWSTSTAIIAHFTFNFIQMAGNLGG